MTTGVGISGRVVHVVSHALAGLGFDARRFTPAPGEQPVVDRVVANDLLEAAALELGDPALGLTLARRIPVGSLGVLDYALLTSATVRDSVARVARHYAVATQCVRIEVEEGPRQTRLVFHRIPPNDLGRHWVELSLGVFADRFRSAVGSPLPYPAVSFRHAAPADHAIHDAYFAGPVTFGAAVDCLTLETAWMDLPLLTASRGLVGLLDARLRELSPEPTDEHPTLAKIRGTLAALLGDPQANLGLEAIARRMGMSRRTLQRTLQAQRTSLTQLLDGLRRERAARMLHEGRRIVEVAEELGFSEPSAFFRAYRRWTGMSPKGREHDFDRERR